LHSGYIESAANGNLSLKMSSLSKINGYNITLDLGGEDEDLCARILKEFGSESIYFDQKLWVTHDMKDSLSSGLKRSYRYGRTSANTWIRIGGIPTFLPLPVIFISFLFLCIAIAPWAITVAFLVVYPNVFIPRKSSKKFFYSLNFFINQYTRIIIEIAHNIGFILGFILGKSRQVKVSNQND
jgi:hypothetical protein